MIMNAPTCLDCEDYQLTPGAFAPGSNNEDKGRVTLQAGVAYTVTFTRISVLTAANWIFRGIPSCYNAAGEMVGHEITNKTGTGFTVTALEDSTFEFNCVRI